MPGTRKLHTGRARVLRRTATDAERKLWTKLRALPVSGGHFRRQVPIGPYIVDFAALSQRLIVEIDGGQHYREDGAAADRQRDGWLAVQGFRVLRFSNDDVLRNLDGVLEAIAASPAPAPPPPTPPRKGEGGKP